MAPLDTNVTIIPPAQFDVITLASRKPEGQCGNASRAIRTKMIQDEHDVSESYFFTHWLGLVSRLIRIHPLNTLIMVSTSNIYITLFCQQIHCKDSSGTSSNCLSCPSWFPSCSLVYDFVACNAPSAAEHAKAQREKSAITKMKNAFNCAHRQLHCHPSQGPSTPASRPLRQATAAEPRACGFQTQDNADTSYPKRGVCISLASLCPTTK